MNVARLSWPHLTRRQRLVLHTLLSASLAGCELAHTEAARSAGVNMRSAGRTLDRLERLGWAEVMPEERTDGRPPRRMYRLAGTGQARVMSRLGLLPALLREEAKR